MLTGGSRLEPRIDLAALSLGDRQWLEDTVDAFADHKPSQPYTISLRKLGQEIGLDNAREVREKYRYQPIPGPRRIRRDPIEDCLEKLRRLYPRLRLGERKRRARSQSPGPPRGPGPGPGPGPGLPPLFGPEAPRSPRRSPPRAGPSPRRPPRSPRHPPPLQAPGLGLQEEELDAEEQKRRRRREREEDKRRHELDEKHVDEKDEKDEKDEGDEQDEEENEVDDSLHDLGADFGIHDADLDAAIEERKRQEAEDKKRVDDILVQPGLGPREVRRGRRRGERKRREEREGIDLERARERKRQLEAEDAELARALHVANLEEALERNYQAANRQRYRRELPALSTGRRTRGSGGRRGSGYVYWPARPQLLPGYGAPGELAFLGGQEAAPVAQPSSVISSYLPSWESVKAFGRDYVAPLLNEYGPSAVEAGLQVAEDVPFLGNLAERVRHKRERRERQEDLELDRKLRREDRASYQQAPSAPHSAPRTLLDTPAPRVPGLRASYPVGKAPRVAKTKRLRPSPYRLPFERPSRRRPSAYYDPDPYRPKKRRAQSVPKRKTAKKKRAPPRRRYDDFDDDY